MKKAFVTGAAGFLGLNLVERLLSHGWNVTALHLPGEDLRYLSRFSAERVAGDILNYPALLESMPEGQDVVFHLAGDTSMWPRKAQRQYNVNVRGTANVCKAAMKKKAARCIFTSSSSSYGYHAGRISERTPSNALTCGMNYNRTKYLAEQEVKKSAVEGLFAVILNPCNIIGPYDPGNWSQLIKNVYQGRLPGIPPGVGTFSHVRDIADAHISAAEKGRKGENYLLGGVEATFKDVILEIMKVTRKHLPLKEVSERKLKLAMVLSSLKSVFNGQEPVLTYPKYKRLVGRLTCDDSKAVRELGFQTTSISEMVSDCYRWLKQEAFL